MFQLNLTGDSITAVLAGVTTFVVLLALAERFRAREPLDYLPGPPTWPVVGNLPSLAKNAHLQLTAWQATYGDVFRVRMGLQDTVVISGKETIREALVRKAEHFSSRPDLFLMHCCKQCNGIALRPYGEPWKRLRRFSMSTLRSCGMGKDIIEERVKNECHLFCAELQRKEDHPFDLTHLLHNAVSNIICSMALGKRFEYGDPTFLRLMETIQRGSELFISAHVINIYPVLRFVPLVGRLYKECMEITEEIRDCMMDLIGHHKAKRTSDEANNIIDSFTKTMELDPNSLPDDSLMYLLVDLFAAGTETTANTLRWGLLYLMTHPDVQTKVQAELDDVVGRDRPPAVSDKANLPYTEATIMEMQRIRTVLPLSVPHCTSSDTTLLGYDIPAGTDVLINLWSLHMDPSRWDNPKHFDPTRFLDDNGQVQTRDSFMPFSAGRRVCLGEQLAKVELFLLLTTMLQHFTFALPEGAQPNFDGILGVTLPPESFELIAVRRT